MESSSIYDEQSALDDLIAIQKSLLNVNQDEDNLNWLTRQVRDKTVQLDSQLAKVLDTEIITQEALEIALKGDRVEFTPNSYSDITNDAFSLSKPFSFTTEQQYKDLILFFRNNPVYFAHMLSSWKSTFHSVQVKKPQTMLPTLRSTSNDEISAGLTHDRMLHVLAYSVIKDILSCSLPIIDKTSILHTNYYGWGASLKRSYPLLVFFKTLVNNYTKPLTPQCLSVLSNQFNSSLSSLLMAYSLMFTTQYLVNLTQPIMTYITDNPSITTDVDYITLLHSAFMVVPKICPHTKRIITPSNSNNTNTNNGSNSYQSYSPSPNHSDIPHTPHTPNSENYNENSNENSNVPSPLFPSNSRSHSHLHSPSSVATPLSPLTPLTRTVSRSLSSENKSNKLNKPTPINQPLPCYSPTSPAFLHSLFSVIIGSNLTLASQGLLWTLTSSFLQQLFATTHTRIFHVMFRCISDRVEADMMLYHHDDISLGLGVVRSDVGAGVGVGDGEVEEKNDTNSIPNGVGGNYEDENMKKWLMLPVCCPNQLVISGVDDFDNGYIYSDFPSCGDSSHTPSHTPSDSINMSTPTSTSTHVPNTSIDVGAAGSLPSDPLRAIATTPASDPLRMSTSANTPIGVSPLSPATSLSLSTHTPNSLPSPLTPHTPHSHTQSNLSSHSVSHHPLSSPTPNHNNNQNNQNYSDSNISTNTGVVIDPDVPKITAASYGVLLPLLLPQASTTPSADLFTSSAHTLLTPNTNRTPVVDLAAALFTPTVPLHTLIDSAVSLLAPRPFASSTSFNTINNDLFLNEGDSNSPHPHHLSLLPIALSSPAALAIITSLISHHPELAFVVDPAPVSNCGRRSLALAHRGSHIMARFATIIAIVACVNQTDTSSPSEPYEHVNTKCYISQKRIGKAIDILQHALLDQIRTYSTTSPLTNTTSDSSTPSNNSNQTNQQTYKSHSVVSINSFFSALRALICPLIMYYSKLQYNSDLDHYSVFDDSQEHSPSPHSSTDLFCQKKLFRINSFKNEENGTNSDKIEKKSGFFRFSEFRPKCSDSECLEEESENDGMLSPVCAPLNVLYALHQIADRHVNTEMAQHAYTINHNSNAIPIENNPTNDSDPSSLTNDLNNLSLACHSSSSSLLQQQLSHPNQDHRRVQLSSLTSIIQELTNTRPLVGVSSSSGNGLRYLVLDIGVSALHSNSLLHKRLKSQLSHIVQTEADLLKDEMETDKSNDSSRSGTVDYKAWLDWCVDAVNYLLINSPAIDALPTHNSEVQSLDSVLPYTLSPDTLLQYTNNTENSQNKKKSEISVLTSVFCNIASSSRMERHGNSVAFTECLLGLIHNAPPLFSQNHHQRLLQLSLQCVRQRLSILSNNKVQSSLLSSLLLFNTNLENYTSRSRLCVDLLHNLQMRRVTAAIMGRIISLKQYLFNNIPTTTNHTVGHDRVCQIGRAATVLSADEVLHHTSQTNAGANTHTIVLSGAAEAEVRKPAFIAFTTLSDNSKIFPDCGGIFPCNSAEDLYSCSFCVNKIEHRLKVVMSFFNRYVADKTLLATMGTPCIVNTGKRHIEIADLLGSGGGGHYNGVLGLIGVPNLLSGLSHKIISDYVISQSHNRLLVACPTADARMVSDFAMLKRIFPTVEEFMKYSSAPQSLTLDAYMIAPVMVEHFLANTRHPQPSPLGLPQPNNPNTTDSGSNNPDNAYSKAIYSYLHSLGPKPESKSNVAFLGALTMDTCKSYLHSALTLHSVHARVRALTQLRSILSNCMQHTVVSKMDNFAGGGHDAYLTNNMKKIDPTTSPLPDSSPSLHTLSSPTQTSMMYAYHKLESYRDYANIDLHSDNVGGRSMLTALKSTPTQALFDDWVEYVDPVLLSELTNIPMFHTRGISTHSQAKHSWGWIDLFGLRKYDNHVFNSGYSSTPTHFDFIYKQMGDKITQTYRYPPSLSESSASVDDLMNILCFIILNCQPFHLSSVLTYTKLMIPGVSNTKAFLDIGVAVRALQVIADRLRYAANLINKELSNPNRH